MAGNWLDQIEQDMNWRTHELASLKIQAVKEVKGSVPYIGLLRAMLTMLYAHYEGFCFFSLNVYLDYLRREGAPRRNHREGLLLFSLEGEFRRLRGDISSESLYRQLTQDLQDQLDAPFDYEIDPKTGEANLRGRSNLYPDMLAETLDKLSLQHECVDSNKRRLWQLVERRNQIAHGRKALIKTLDDYQPFYDAVQYVMHEIAISMMESITSKSYLTIAARTRFIAERAYEIWHGKGCPSGAATDDWLQAEAELSP